MSDMTNTEIADVFRKEKVVWAVRAVSALVIGILVLVWPQSTAAIVGVLLGLYFIILGVLRVIQGFVDKDLNGGGRAANFILGAVVLAAGIVVLKNPFATAVFVVILIGISWIFEGIATVASAARGNGGFGTVVVGLLIAVAGLVVIFFAPAATAAFAIFLGIAMIAVGILSLALLFTVGREIKKAS
jgi:uncharacterized membrane protein HdeD (DUF308 family)